MKKQRSDKQAEKMAIKFIKKMKKSKRLIIKK